MNNAEIIKEVLKLLNSINLSPEDLQDVQKNGPSGKREYKDSLFVYLFGNEKYKNLTLELYNAINKTHYTNPDEMEITTLEDYAAFVGNVKKNGRTSENLKDAIDMAIDVLPENSAVGTILKNNRSEVVSMCLEEYTQEYADKLHRYELEEANKKTEEAKKETEEAKKEAEELKSKIKEELLKNGYSLEKINELIGKD